LSHLNRGIIVKRIAVLAALLAGFLALAAGLSAPAAHAATTQYAGARILDQAETRVNDSYVFGSAGPSYFDCSGLVYWAATSTGEANWPRDTQEIAAQIGHRFVITTHPVRGDLAMWGSVGAPYHVEIVTAWASTNFGAEQPGWSGRVTWHSDTWFKPSFFLHILY
jgi:peptidoglycan DL-endopeptidase CwlO